MLGCCTCRVVPETPAGASIAYRPHTNTCRHPRPTPATLQIRNGRLAMVAFLGFAAQYAATGKGPIDNLVDHVADPFHTTFVHK